MTDRPPPKSRVAPSPAIVASLLVLVLVFTLVAVYLTPRLLQAPTAIQTLEILQAASAPRNENARPNAVAQATATDQITEEATEEPEPDIPTPTQPPEPTAYVPGPTAQFETILPIGDWLEFRDEQAGFSIKYPPDWYLKTTPPEERAAGSTTQFVSYDPNNPDAVPKGTNKPENFVKLEITTDSLQAMGQPFLPNETLPEWVHRNRATDGEDLAILEERETTLGGRQAFYQVTLWKGVVKGATYYIHRDSNMVFVGYLSPPPESWASQVFDQMLASLSFMD